MFCSREEIENFFNDENIKDKPPATKRKEFEKWLCELRDEFAASLDYKATLDANLKDKRIKECENDYLKFFNTYLSHYASIGGVCELHTYLADYFNNLGTHSIKKRAVAAPRGHAKSTHCSVGLVLWCIVYKKKRFIVEISDAIELAEANLEAIKVELECNENLKADFGDLVGDNWKVGEFITKNGVKVKAFGSGKRLRGIRYGAYRPDLAILDDLENDTNVRSKEQRDKLEDWLDEAVLNLGSLDDTLDVLYIGTILHQDSVLNRKLKNEFWITKKFSSIIHFPYRLDLWDEYIALYKTDKARAEGFYKANETLMKNGSEVLWESARDIKKLMQLRAENLRAFNKEQLNEPLNDKQRFKLENISFYDYLTKCDFYVMYCDPAGNGKKSDYTAITILGVNKTEQKAYVCESIVKVMDSKTIINTLCDLQERYHCSRVAVETNGGQFHLKAWILEKAFAKNLFMPLQGVNNHKNKLERIESLEMPILNKEIIFNKEHKLLLEQLLEFPEGKNDDAPDSLAGAYMLTKLNKKIRRRTGAMVSRRRR